MFSKEEAIHAIIGSDLKETQTNRGSVTLSGTNNIPAQENVVCDDNLSKLDVETLFQKFPPFGEQYWRQAECMSVYVNGTNPQTNKRDGKICWLVNTSVETWPVFPQHVPTRISKRN